VEQKAGRHCFAARRPAPSSRRHRVQFSRLRFLSLNALPHLSAAIHEAEAALEEMRAELIPSFAVSPAGTHP